LSRRQRRITATSPPRGRGRPLVRLTARAGPRPGPSVPAGTAPLTRFQLHRRGDDRADEPGGEGAQEQEKHRHDYRCRGIDQHADGDARPHGDGRDPAGADLDRPYRRPVPGRASWPPQRRRDGARQRGQVRPGGDVRSERVQICIGPSRQRVADPVVKFVFSKPLVHERDLQHVDRPLPVGARDPHMAMAARTRCRFASRPRHRCLHREHDVPEA
jgi:hypothetical protein